MIFIMLKDMEYLFEIQVKTNMSRCNVIEVVPSEIDCVLEIKGKKNTGSRLIKCPFQIVGKKVNDGTWALKAKNLTHNHEPSTDISGHPSFRRLLSDDVQSVKSMTLSAYPKANSFFFASKKPKASGNLSNCIQPEGKNPQGKLEKSIDDRDDEDSYIWALSVFKKILENRDRL